MKSIRRLGVMVLVALTATAFVDTSSTMAESILLCRTDGSPCVNSVTHLHETTLTESPFLLLNALGNIKCNALFLSTSVGNLGAPQAITANFTFSSCKRKKISGEEECTVSEVNGPTESNVLKEGHETAKAISKGEVKITCGAFIACVYGGESLIGTVKGPLLSANANGELSLLEQAMKRVSGAFCPEKATLDLTATPLEASYISS